MESTTHVDNLAAALAKAQGEMPAVKFDSTNPFLRNRYASLGAIIATSKPVLAKYGLAVTQLVYNEGDQVGVETILMHSSGDRITTKISMGTEAEKGKSAAQVAGSIITYLRRYSLAAILGMYADEDGDGNTPKPAQTHEETEAEAEPVVASMTIERACAITNSEGVKYGDIASDKLQAMVLGINKGLKNGIDDAKKAEYLEKKQAIGVILKARANKEI